MQVEHVQPAPGLATAAGLIPAADQSNAFACGADVAGAARGVSQIVHFSTAVPGLDNMQVEHVQLVPLLAAAAGFDPAAAQSNAFTGGRDVGAVAAGGALLSICLLKSKVGSEVFGVDVAALRALTSWEVLEDGMVIVTEKEYVGKAWVGTTSAASFAKLGALAAGSASLCLSTAAGRAKDASARGGAAAVVERVEDVGTATGASVDDGGGADFKPAKASLPGAVPKAAILVDGVRVGEGEVID